MDLQPARTRRLAGMLCLFGICGMLSMGCAASGRPTYDATLVSDMPSGRVYESRHFRLHTTLYDPARVWPMVQTLEAGLAAYEAFAGVRADQKAEKMDVFVFRTRAEWEQFTRARTGADAPIYLQLDRGGYTFDRFCVVRDQGERDTLTVLAHEGLHLFVSAHFVERPPPFLEEGMAVMFETIDDGGALLSIRVGENDARARALARMRDTGRPFLKLRTLLSMHAGNVVGSSERDVDAFYAHAWALVRYLSDPETPRQRREGFIRLVKDAASGALSSRDLPSNPELIERYMGESLESMEPEYLAYCLRLASGAAEERE